MPDRIPDDRTRDAVARGSVNDPGIRIAISDPTLADKLKVRKFVPSDMVCWYIKFNIVLDPLTVTHKTMTVTETNGYILETHISYDIDKNLIVIKPTDPYEEDIFYVLNITRKVRSKGGNRLKRDIYILFKIKGNRIQEYNILPADAVVEKPRKKPEKLKAETAARARGAAIPVQAKPETKPEKARSDTLPYGDFPVNIVIPAIGIPITITGLILDIFFIMIGGTLLLVAGVVHMSVQMRNKRKRAALLYNFGVISFNAGRYKSAAKRINRAYSLDPQNLLAEDAAEKLSQYLK